MRRILLSIAALATFMLVVPAPPALHATPIAVWTQPWQVTLGALIASGDAVLSRGFGAVGSANEPLPGTSAVANSLSNVFAALGADSIANTGVNFSRTFTLSGSPDGWFVTLDSSLDGLMIAGGPDDSPAAHLIAFAVISGEGSTFEPYNDNVTATVNAPNNIVPISQAKTHAIILPDGTYTVIGEILTEATVNGYSMVGPITIGDPAGRASSNFADSFTVTTNATPLTGTIAMIPEPSYIVPSAGVLLLLLVTTVRKRPQAGLSNP
ncbi:MAG TPA: hypothetical protein VFC39_13380 [Acidobacteriaceae bacterium]|nr:hypothetical protein [Acidobacteriaceae bacterium]